MLADVHLYTDTNYLCNLFLTVSNGNEPAAKYHNVSLAEIIQIMINSQPQYWPKVDSGTLEQGIQITENKPALCIFYFINFVLVIIIVFSCLFLDYDTSINLA